MIMFTFSILTAVAEFNIAIAKVISFILNYIHICGPIVAIIICTGIIVSKIESLNNKSESDKEK